MDAMRVSSGFPVFQVSLQPNAKTVTARSRSSTALESCQNKFEGSSLKPDEASVYARLTTAGLDLRADGGRLIVTPSHLLTDELRELIRDHKARLVGLLSQAPGPDKYRHEWRVTLPTGERFESSCTPPASRAEVLSWHPEGTRVEPLPDPSPDSPPPMTQAEEAAIRAWFAHIGETAPDLIAPYLDRCQGSLEARRYFLARAATDGAPIVQVDPPAQPATSALVSCSSCHHYRPNAHGWGGLGRCLVNAPASLEPGSLWPRSETRCRDFAPMEVTP